MRFKLTEEYRDNYQKTARKAWAVLAQVASTHQQITYGEIAEKIGLHHRAVEKALALIQSHCFAERLPPLSILAVSKRNGRPGAGFTSEDDINKGRESVYKFVWEKLENPFQKKSHYWMFICNPNKWAIDEFIDAGEINDTWMVGVGDEKNICKGELALVRVGNDKRSSNELGGRPKLVPGLYALCLITSDPIRGTGPSSIYSADGRREPKSSRWHVKVQYLVTFLREPVLLKELKRLNLERDNLFQKSHQSSTAKIPASDFLKVLELLEIDEMELRVDVNTFPSDVTVVQSSDAQLDPVLIERKIRLIERGTVGQLVKKKNGYRCQLCEAMGLPSLGFEKEDGTPYVEAHHAIPLNELKPGTLHQSCIMTLCANHHRQLHLGKEVSVTLTQDEFFVSINSDRYHFPRCKA